MKYSILDKEGALLAIITAESEEDAMRAGKQISNEAYSAEEHHEPEHEMRERG